jgi:peptidoglycan/LPS O-acetylase OafA/YrhL
MGRMDQFAIGMLAALFYRHQHFARIPKMLWGAVLIGISCIGIFSFYGFHKLGGWPSVSIFKLFWPTWEGFIWSVFILSYIALSEKLPERISRWFAALGTLSYSTFLIHFIVINALIGQNWIIAFHVSHEVDAVLNTLFFALPVILAISALTYAVIEKPFLELRMNYHKIPQ